MTWILLLLLLLMVGSEITAAEQVADTATEAHYKQFVKAYVQNFNVQQFLADPEQQKLALENLHALRRLLPDATKDQIWESLVNIRAKQEGYSISRIKTYEDLFGTSFPQGMRQSIGVHSVITVSDSYPIIVCTKCAGKTPNEQTHCANRIDFIVNLQLQKLLSEDKSLIKLSSDLVTIVYEYAKIA